MNIHILFEIIGCMIGICTYVVLAKDILMGGKHSFASWALWVCLDAIALEGIITQKGNWAVLALFVTGGTFICCLLFYKGQFQWEWFELLVLASVIICLVIRFKGGENGPRWATIWSTIAVVIAGLPAIRDLWTKPDRKTAQIFVSWTFVNIFFFLAGKAWTVEERFYPALMIPLCLAIAFAASRTQRTELQIREFRFLKLE